jgi:7,8-dihydro-6-hydroxymethylpterin-pyrophosphokinase
MNPHSVLISISTDLMAGNERLQYFIQQLREVGEIVQTSSVYKKFLSERSKDLNSSLIVALRMETERDRDEIFALLQKLEQKKETSFAASPENLILLAFDQEIRMRPGQNLPHPKLHTDTLTLRCAGEAWPEYTHPVLGQTLRELVRCSDPLKHVEFFAQGRSLLSTEPT